MTLALGSNINNFYNNHLPEGYSILEPSKKDIVKFTNSKLDMPPNFPYNLVDFGVLVNPSTNKKLSFEKEFLKCLNNF
jgi:hypothetical protein